ncbi:class I SAM-dependent methyltransferase [Synechococcus sp. BA-124 BA4]|uniref:class I SAM-dependent methyltransferase n=1 Tax=unclassified Synechococcus TaxID=2626047 RepID=UPI0018CF10B4|nr:MULTISPECIES: class I SAM-dependent methyltransferase [unclassified Synechococcus]MEA5398517.1 class I SAM-dependent methyltransferase [Synechococcus sp. BA-124 BA4]QPN56851.1 class I SAM-dependent methyltransferase [Synechococcus sp. CBW1107]CAK6696833.1 Trans-aconitate 2-methyltransferase [Synechococcus sp. CBW1107]
MDGAEQAWAYAAADFNASDQAMVDRIALCFGSRLGERILDLGCGPGNITFRLASRYPSSRVVGVDGSGAMLAIALARLDQRRQHQQDSPPCGSVSFVQALLPSSRLQGGYDAVVSNSLLHHLHDPQVLWSTVRQLAAPGAAIYIKDLRRPPDQTTLERLVATHAAGAPPVLRHDYRQSLGAAFTVQEVQDQLRQAGLGQLLVREAEDRYLEVMGRHPA